MRFIEVSIRLMEPDTANLENLGLDVSGDDIPVKAMIDLDAVIEFNPDDEGQTNINFNSGLALLADIDYEEFKKVLLA